MADFIEGTNSAPRSKPHSKEALEHLIIELETAMLAPDFWANKDKAQQTIRDIQVFKDQLEGAGKYDKGNAIMTIFSGAGGDDAEDFTGILLRMYTRYADSCGWGMKIIDDTPNDHGGYRNITVELSGKSVYGTLKNESGVHRLVRVSPFNSKGLRHTSFSMVEVTPAFTKNDTDVVLNESELDIITQKAGGPGGQNVNKRETAVRIVHLPTKLSVHVSSERSQAQNKERALELLKGKLYKHQEDERTARQNGMFISKTTSIDWGNQIRSYVMHPYKMVKDHRTNVETSQIDRVLDGDLEAFIEAEK